MGSVKKKCKVVMLPTEKAKNGANLIHKSYDGDTLRFWKFDDKDDAYVWMPQHIYVLSDDKVKVGDFCVNLFSNSLLKIEAESDSDYDVEFITGGNISNRIYKEDWSNAELKKIISTTDRSLMIKNQKINQQSVILMPAPSSQFIQKYIEKHNSGKPITDVMVEYEIDMINELSSGNTPSDTCLKINRKDYTITISQVKDSYTEKELFENMQYYMEYCQMEGYVTPMDWLAKHKHF